MLDVLVIGGGPAGISAAIYLKRFKLDVLVVMKDFGSLDRSGHIENYYGFPDPMTGRQVVENGLAQAKRLGIEVRTDEVIGIENGNTFVVKTVKNVYEAKAVLLARPNLRIPGFSEYVGKGISYCAICDGFLFKKKAIAVLGEGEFMAEELGILRNFTSDLTVFTNGRPLAVPIEGAQVVTDPITGLEGEDGLKTIVAGRTPSATDFALRMGAFIDNNMIAVDDNFMTNIPGLFAAGDCIGGLSQIAKAVSDGALASVSINKYLHAKTL
jgi:thioredoxin reductase (NADPH)